MKKIQVMVCLLGYCLSMHSSENDSRIKNQEAIKVAMQIKELQDKWEDGTLIRELEEHKLRQMRGDGVRPGVIPHVSLPRLQDIFAELMLAKKK